MKEGLAMRKVTLAYPRTVGGKDHKADDTVEVEDHEAVDLINSGLAREAETKAAKAAESKG